MLSMAALASGIGMMGPMPSVPHLAPRRYDPRVSCGGGRGRKGHSLAEHGLNGKRAVARRLRQIEAGRYPKGSWINGSGATLRAANGLVSA